MRVLVQVACELDPKLNLRVNRRTGEVRPEEGDHLYRVWPLGRLGVSAALSLANAEVVAFALGEDNDFALQHAVAAGARSSYRLSYDEDVIPTQALADWIREQEADLVIADRLAGGLSWHLGYSHLAGLSDLRVENGRLRAYQQMGKGNRYEVTAALPSVIRLSSEKRVPPYISRTRIRNVEIPCWEEVSLHSSAAELGSVDVGKLQPARARTRGAKKSQTKSKASDRVKALMGLSAPSTPPPASTPSKGEERSPESMAQEFVRYLKHHDLISKEH